MTESFVFSLETITVYSDFPFGSSHICASCGYVSAEDKCTLRAASPGASGLLYSPCQKNHFYPHINPTTSRSPVARPTEQLCLFLRRPFFFLHRFTPKTTSDHQVCRLNPIDMDTRSGFPISHLSEPLLDLLQQPRPQSPRLIAWLPWQNL